MAIGEDDAPPIQTNMDTPDVAPAALTPVAQPTAIRFLAPDAVRDSSLMDLAKGLSAFDAGLGNFLGAKQQQQDAADKLQGEADFHKNNAEGYADAVRNRHIPAFASKSYMDAYKGAQGAVAGNDLIEKANAAYDGWSGKTDTDPAAYQKFITGFIRDNISTDDPAVYAGLLPKINQLTSQLQSRHIQDLHTATVNGNLATHAALVSQGLDAGVTQGIATGKGFNVDAGYAVIASARDNIVKTGGSADDFDTQTINAITAEALQARGQGGPQVLALLDRKIPGTDRTYAQTAYGADQKQKTQDKLAAWGRQAYVDAGKVQAAKDAEALRDITVRTQNALAANPGQPIPENLLAAGQALDGEFRTKATAWNNTLSESGGLEDPQAVLKLNRDLTMGTSDYKAGDPRIINDALNNGVIKTTQTLSAVNTLRDKVLKSGDMASVIESNEVAKGILSSIKDRTEDKVSVESKMHGGNGTAGLSDAGLAAAYDYRSQILDWAAQHPNATTQEQNAAAEEIGTRLLKFIKPPTIAGGAVYSGGEYNPPSTANGAPPTPPVSGGPASTLPPPASPSAPATSPPVEQPQQQGSAVDPAKVERFLSYYNSQQKVDLAKSANKQGITFQKAAEQAYLHANPPVAPPTAYSPTAAQPSAAPTAATQQRSDNGTSSPIQAAFHQALGNWKEDDDASPDVIEHLRTAFSQALHGSGNTQGSYNLAALKDDPKAAHILDFVAGPESKGNYNAFYGHAGSQSDLSKQTLDEILKWQKQRTNDGSPSSATGRYQFMYKTLQSLKTRMGLTGNEKFTPLLQDQLAVQLLKDRGYDRWKSGSMDDNAFANNLAKEWASLPNLHTGKSQYDGDGLNHSLVTPRQVVGMLNEASEK